MRSLRRYREQLLDDLLAFLWGEWARLGVAGYGTDERPPQVIDPEALLLFSLGVARYDARLFDEVLDWLAANSRHLNIQRLTNLMRRYRFGCGRQLAAAAERLAQGGEKVKWRKLATMAPGAEPEPLFRFRTGEDMPLPGEMDAVFLRHGLLRNPVRPRGLSGLFPAVGTAPLILRLRAFMGVSSRCEALCLLAGGAAYPADVARRTDYSTRGMQETLIEMERSGLVYSAIEGKNRVFRLDTAVVDGLFGPMGAPVRWVWWSSLFSAVERALLLFFSPRLEGGSALLAASEMRLCAREIGPLLRQAGFVALRDPSLFTGEAYGEVFLEDIASLTEALKKGHPMILPEPQKESF